MDVEKPGYYGNFGGAVSLGLLPSCPPAHMVQGVGVGQWFQIPREGLAGKPAC